MNNFDSRVHHGLVESALHRGRLPSTTDLAATLGVEVDEVRQSLRRLEASHGIVLHPHVCEPWVIHPFSASPSATWVEGSRRGWWAPCMWCAFGIAQLAGEAVTIHSRIGGESETVQIHIAGGQVRETNLWVHFAIPPRAAWNNVHHFCATVLPFHEKAQVAEWSERHGIPLGSVMPIQQCADLGREWYRPYANPDWQKWTVSAAAAIFASVGLGGAFWELPASDGNF